ncbi:MAG TPA: TIGR00300 family protein [Acidobacteriota bacterium]|jgi:lysine-ketoglutarate reductase/saccharopine dehydrogenase-like protein (TIGR00300 family)|nr:TIGR00300 family protein [Acidobacteriota bacterium]
MNNRKTSEVVEARGHLIDSQLMTKIFDKVIEYQGQFEILNFEIGRTNQDYSSARLRVNTPDESSLISLLEELMSLGCYVLKEHDAALKSVVQDRCVPEDFYSTTNHRTQVRVDGKWIDVERQRMDAILVVESNGVFCKKLRDIRSGDRVVCGVEGIRVQPEFKSRDRYGFAFMASDVSTERRVEISTAKLAQMMHDLKGRGGRIGLVAGPVVVHTGGAPYLADIICKRFVSILLSGNALAVHDIEHALFKTSLGVNLETGIAVSEGHKNHMRAINTIYRAGGIRQAVASGILKSGIMYECVRNAVPFVLAGSIRDDGPLPETIMDLIAAQEAYAEAVQDVDMILMLGSMLHSIGVGNMIPSWITTVCVDINAATVTKLSDRGSAQAIGIVTDVGLFLSLLHKELAKYEVRSASDE